VGLAYVIERQVRVSRNVKRVAGREYVYGAAFVLLPPELVGKEARVIVIVEE